MGVRDPYTIVDVDTKHIFMSRNYDLNNYVDTGVMIHSGSNNQAAIAQTTTKTEFGSIYSVINNSSSSSYTTDNHYFKTTGSVEGTKVPTVRLMYMFDVSAYYLNGISCLNASPYFDSAWNSTYYAWRCAAQPLILPPPGYTPDIVA